MTTPVIQPRLRLGRSLLYLLLFIGLSGAGLYTVYRQLPEASLGLDPRLFAPGVLAAAAALLVCYFAADGLRLHYTLRALGQRVPARDMARLVFINIFVSNITPLATGGGLVQVWYLRRRGVPLGTATGATTIRTVLALLFIFGAAPLALLGLESLQGLPVLRRLAPVLSAFIVLYLAAFALILLRPRWLLPPLEAVPCLLARLHLLGARRAARWRYHLRRELLRFARSFGRYLRGPRRYVLLSVLSTVLFLLSLFSFPALLMWALGYTVDYPRVLGLVAFTTFLMYFAPTPGAAGIAEGVFARLFAMLVSGPHLLLITVAWRFLTIYIGVLIGMVLLQLELARSRGSSR